MRLRAATLVLAAAAGLAAAGDKPSDGDIARLLVGKWASPAAAKEGSGTIRYRDDGTYAAEGTTRAGGEDVRVSFEGIWKVSGGEVLMEITKSNSGLAPIGTKLTETVKAIDGEVFRFVRGSGDERRRTRVKE